MAGVAGKSGGARTNAGRKTKKENNEGAVIKAERRCADRLPKTIGNLENLADGSAEPEVEEEWLPAGAFTVEEIKEDDEGKPIKTRRLILEKDEAEKREREERHRANNLEQELNGFRWAWNNSLALRERADDVEEQQRNGNPT